MNQSSLQSQSVIERYLSNFEALEKSLNGESSSDIHTIRKLAMKTFSMLGFPTTRNEEWKYTDVSALAKIAFRPSIISQAINLLKNDIEPFTFGNLNAHRLVFVNGYFSPALSSVGIMQQGVELGSLAVAIRSNNTNVKTHLTQYADYESNAFTALSTAFVQDGGFVVVPNGIAVEIPIHLLFISTNQPSEFVAHPRNLILVGKNSQAAIIESHVSMAKNIYFTNTVSEIVLGENANLEYDKLLLENDRAFHIGTTRVELERSSNFISNAIMLGGSLVRNNVVAVLNGEGAECTLNGLYLGTGTQHIDNHTVIDHAKPNCPSHELYKGILSGKSRGVFNGKIKVRKDAQKTDAKQTNKNLILSDEASIDTKPQLEIYANDVKCTHGATIGQLEDEQIFYLRSRGVDFDSARDMLIFAFASDVTDRIKIEPIRRFLQELIHDRLEAERVPTTK
jgi:Fe-S cluster assembly protein SufD